MGKKPVEQMELPSAEAVFDKYWQEKTRIVVNQIWLTIGKMERIEQKEMTSTKQQQFLSKLLDVIRETREA